jgi:predicted Rdx family selenoprotein
MIIAMRAALQPELWVSDTAAAVRYHERAFGAVVEHRVGNPDDPDGVVQLTIGEAAGIWNRKRDGSVPSRVNRRSDRTSLAHRR